MHVAERSRRRRRRRSSALPQRVPSVNSWPSGFRSARGGQRALSLTSTTGGAPMRSPFSNARPRTTGIPIASEIVRRRDAHLQRPAPAPPALGGRPSTLNRDGVAEVAERQSEDRAGGRHAWHRAPARSATGPRTRRGLRVLRVRVSGSERPNVSAPAGRSRARRPACGRSCAAAAPRRRAAPPRSASLAATISAEDSCRCGPDARRGRFPSTCRPWRVAALERRHRADEQPGHQRDRGS